MMKDDYVIIYGDFGEVWNKDEESTMALISLGMYQADYLNTYFEGLRRTVKFKKWFFGIITITGM